MNFHAGVLPLFRQQTEIRRRAGHQRRRQPDKLRRLRGKEIPDALGRPPQHFRRPPHALVCPASARLLKLGRKDYAERKALRGELKVLARERREREGRAVRDVLAGARGRGSGGHAAVVPRCAWLW